MISQTQALAAAALLSTQVLAPAYAASTLESTSMPKPAIAEHFSGALVNVKAPAYDGPVKWGSHGGEPILAAFGLGLTGLFVGGVASSVMSRRHGGMIVLGFIGGALTGGLIGYNIVDETAYALSFQTTIAEITAADPSHYERQGKSTSGPYFSQVVAIPESSLLLAADVQNAPFIPGQTVVATFYMNKADHSIMSWQAEAGPRPGK